jgi:metal-responsive CopG/Arc/MetJ family transcriptional regulator
MIGGKTVKRFSVSLPPALLEEFDKTWRGMRYENRSKAVHDALQKFITDVQLANQEGFVTGVILVLHYLDRPGVLKEVSRVKRKHRKGVSSIQQNYIEDNKVLQIISVITTVGELERFTQELMAIRGVKEVKTSIIAI